MQIKLAFLSKALVSGVSRSVAVRFIDSAQCHAANDEGYNAAKTCSFDLIKAKKKVDFRHLNPV